MFTSIAAFLGLEIKDRISRLVTAAGLALVGIFFLIVAGAYLMGWVKTRFMSGFDPATADLILFGVFLLIGGGFALAGYLASRAKPQRSMATAALAAAPLASTMARSSLPNVVKVVPLVIIGGLFLGRHFANRE